MKSVSTMEALNKNRTINYGYRFLVTSKQNNETLGTGFFKTSRKMTKDDLLSFFHQYTQGLYIKQESFVNIDIFEAEA